MLGKLAFILCILLPPALPLSARDKELTILDHKEYSFFNKDCAKSKTCSLKRVRFIEENYKIGIGKSYNYGERFFGEYETSSAAAIRDYLFVQFIKGCVYSAKNNGDGPVSVSYDVYLEHFGKRKEFHFKDWVIDSDIDDPALSSTPQSRYGFLRWNTVRDSFDKSTEKPYVEEIPTYPRVYLSNHGGGSAFNEGPYARNVSLEFKTRLYKAKDVPAAADPDDLNFAEPIVCYRSRSSFVFNYETKKFDQPQEIVPACK